MAARELLRLEAVARGQLAVAHLQGGISAWVSAGHAGEGTGEWSARKGRVPSVGGANTGSDISCEWLWRLLEPNVRTWRATDLC